MRYPRIGILALALLVPFAGIARAGVFALPDHFKCHKTKKDTLAKATYTADLFAVHPSFPNESGCQIRVPAKMVCTGKAKVNVSPEPPGAPPGLNTFERLACYKLKCPKQEFTIQVRDQFGDRTMTVKAPSVLCAPFDVD
jgi:hypothetical protein